VMQTYKRLPVAFESGSGVWLTDTEGNRYLDALAGIAVCGLGHAHPAVEQALVRQAGKLVHTSNLYLVPLQEELASELCSLSGLDKVFFCNSGAEANEAAIKLCRKYAHEQGNPSPRIVTMHGSFHGRTMATLSATGNKKIKAGFEPLLEGFLHIPYNDVGALEQACKDYNDIVAVMLEPILGEGGIVVPAHGYLKKVAELCNQNDLLLVVDEVQTGLCRTGRWFGFQHEDIMPDIVTLAKSLGNGVPIGACMANNRASAPMSPGSHGTTFGGNPLAASAALAVLRFLKDNRMELRSAELGKRMLDGFRTGLAGLQGIREIRGVGLMLGIELEKDCAGLVLSALKRNLLINVTADRVVRLLPPLVMSDADADYVVSTVTDLIREFLQG